MVHLFVVGGLIALLSYYMAFRCRKPIFLGGKGDMQNLVKIVSSRTGIFCPTSWSIGGHLHTIFGNILKSRPKINYRSEDIETPDGGTLRLDWNMGDHDGITGDTKDIVLILPGLTGTSQEKYVLHLVDIARDLGYGSTVLNYRGSGIPLKTYRMSCASSTDDLQLALEHIYKSFPTSRICVVGVSLGGIILTNYLTEMGSANKKSSLHAAFVVSIPWDLFVAAESLEKPVTWFLFNRYLTQKLKRLFAVNIAALRAKKVEVPENIEGLVGKVNTIRKFDAAVIAPMFGYSDVNDYYEAASVSHKALECIKTPLLCLNAADDHFSPLEQIPVERIRNCENVALILTHTGGHAGFLEGLLPTDLGYMGRVYRQYIQAVFQSKE